MPNLEQLKQIFINPPSEFTPIPFWFWNDDLTEEELKRQIHEFHAKEVDGFVIHPRMGLPRSIPYLSDVFMNLVEVAVTEAAALGMTIILYDEGMYPSGSACGLVVKENPEYASRGLQLREVACGKSNEKISVEIELAEGERLVSVQAARKLTHRTIDQDSIVVLEVQQGSQSVEFTPTSEGDWNILIFVEVYSKGTIRGVHAGQDDGEPEVPLAADLLNIEATQTFIRLTHDKYYAKLSPYFGSTIIAMFTDEPDLLGRGHLEGLMPWTTNFMEEFASSVGDEQQLVALWYEVGEDTEGIRYRYNNAVQSRMIQTYYKPLSDWCAQHSIALTGHPALSGDIGLLEYFQIPGQDLVWRYIAPEGNKSIAGEHSTMGKCSSDAARHRGRRRNLNEVFGVCGIEGGWSLTADNMKWYLDWLFVRGVNLISPHAFYYSIRDERRDERPPDVGLHNIWWQDYGQFSRYIKRMSWLMTDSSNVTEVAVLTGKTDLPWEIVKPLYEQQIEFNYLEEALLASAVTVVDGELHIKDYRYKVVLIEHGSHVAAESWSILKQFIAQGGLVIEWSESGQYGLNIGQLVVEQAQDIVAVLDGKLGRAVKLAPVGEHIRISTIKKDGHLFYVVVNEDEAPYQGVLTIEGNGLTEIWHPWEGSCEAAIVEMNEGHQSIALQLERRQCLVIAVDAGVEPIAANVQGKTQPLQVIADLSLDWVVTDGAHAKQLSQLSSWTEWEAMKHFSGTLTYEKRFSCEDLLLWSAIQLDLGTAEEHVRLEVNGQTVGVRMWKPYTFDIKDKLQSGENVLRVVVTNSLANEYDRKSFQSGLIGPVSLLAK